MARSYKAKGEARGLNGLRSLEFNVNQLRGRGCLLIDLTAKVNRDIYLGTAVMTKSYVQASQEVLVHAIHQLHVRLSTHLLKVKTSFVDLWH